MGKYSTKRTFGNGRVAQTERTRTVCLKTFLTSKIFTEKVVLSFNMIDELKEDLKVQIVFEYAFVVFCLLSSMFLFFQVSQ